MEALSSAASVIAVVQITGSIVQICGGYISKVKSAKQDILRLQQEVSSLGEVLRMLNELLHGPDSTKLTTSHTLFNDVANCSSTLTILKEKIDLETTQNPMRRWGLRAFKWPLQHTEVEKVISDIKGYISLFSLALQTNHIKSTNNIDQRLDMDRLRIADGAAFDSYENKHDQCLPGTRVKLIHQVKEWAESSHGKCIFWLNGMAGTGKSTVSLTVASQLKEKQLLAASFFFKRGEKDRGNAKRLFPTLTSQLVNSIPPLAPGVQKAIKDDPYISEKALGEQFDKLILRPLLSVNIDQITPMVIVVDALDECEWDENRDDIRVVLKILPQVQRSNSIRLRFFLTSRPELPIRLGFKAITGDHQYFDLHEVPTPAIEHDISLFLKDKFSQIREDHKLPLGWPNDKDIQTLVSRTVPLFISAATLCRFVGDVRWNAKDRLKTILVDQSTYVSKMDNTYLPVLNQLFVGQDEWEIRKLIQEFKGIVGIIIILAAPLSVNALAQLLDIEAYVIHTRLDLLHSALNIPSDWTTPVRLLHLSFRDFLLDTKRKGNLFWIDEKEMHQNLTVQCLWLLCYRLKKNICNIPQDDTQRQDIPMDAINLYLPAELQYCCRYWAQHLIQSKDLIRMLDDAFSFLKMHFLHWMEAMSILGIISEVFNTIDSLQTVIQHDEGSEISKFLQDAKRYILKNRQIADTTPLQLYCSGLVFAPSKSIIRQKFKEELPSWISRLPNVEKFWSAELQTLEGHSSWIRSVTFSPDGRLLASGSGDRTVKLWDTATGALQQTLEGHSGWVGSVTFSPDGQLLASGSGDKTVKIWDPATGALQQTLESHLDWVESVTFSSNSQLLASGSDDNTIKLWSLATGAIQKTLKGHSGLVQSVTFSPNGQLLASGSEDNTVKLWDTLTGALQQTLKGHLDWVQSVTFSLDGRLLASGSGDGTVKLWDPATGTLQQTLKGHSGWVGSVTFSPDGQLLASGSSDRTVKLWDLATEGLPQTLKGHLDWVQSVVFSSDGRLLASGSDDRTVKLWDTATRTLRQPLEGYSDSVRSVTFSPDGRLLASGSCDRTVKLWDLATGALQQTLEGHLDWVQPVTFSPDGRLLASGSRDRTIRLWDPATGALQQILKGHSGQVRSVTFSPDGQLLLSGSGDRTAKLWDPATGALQQTLEGHLDSVLLVAFLSDGKLLASGSSDKTIKLWDPATGALQQTLEGHSGCVLSVTFSPDGRLLASASDDRTVKLWDTATGALQQTLEGHSRWVGSVTFSLDGRLLASGSGDMTVKLWDTATGAMQQTLSVRGEPMALSFTEDCSYLKTNLGPFNIQSWYSKVIPYQPKAQGEAYIQDNQWITLHGSGNALWIPPEYRPTCSVVADGTIVLGHVSGRVSFLEFCH